MSPDDREAVEVWARTRDVPASLSEAIRTLVKIGLATEFKRARRHGKPWRRN
jgi:hypothetical protein